MVHEVGADGVVLVQREGQLELGAHAIHGGDEHRLAVFLHVQREQTAEPADLAEDFPAVRGGEQLGQGGFDFVAQINVHAGGGVSFLFHAAEIKAFSGRPGEQISWGCPDLKIDFNDRH